MASMEELEEPLLVIQKRDGRSVVPSIRRAREQSRLHVAVIRGQIVNNKVDDLWATAKVAHY